MSHDEQGTAMSGDGGADGERTAGSAWEAVARFALDVSLALSVEDVVRSLVGVGLPALGAAGCGIVTPAADGGWQLVLSTSFGPDLRARFDHEPFDSPLPACRAAREGRTFLVPDHDAAARVHPRMAEVVEVTDRPRWALLPLRVGEDVVGSLAVSWTAPGPFEEAEVERLEVFAAHCAPTVHRVLLVDQEHRAGVRVGRMVRALQRGVLTEPLDTDGLEIAVSYVPAGDGVDIGGDFYDTFPRARGDVVVAVGDVAGHDHLAAAAMTRVRTLLRGLAWDSDDGPGRLLDRLDAVVAALEPGTTATALVLTCARTDDGALDVRWADAGHPPPVLRRPDGAVRVLQGGGDPLLGVDWPGARTEHHRRLPVGSVLVLVTDGVVETRTTGVMTGLDALAASLHRTTGTDAHQVCAELATAALHDEPVPATAADDRTLLVLRATPLGARTDEAPAADGPHDATAAATRVAVLPPEPRSASTARAVVRSVAGTDGWGEDAVDAAELCVSELVANAVVHARSDIRVSASSTADRLVVEVEDENDRLPELLPPDDEALSGRGLQLVSVAAHEWGVHPVGDGLASKVVWFALHRDAG
ncbi:SpoIIE family protein phosphatase [Kineococcus aurantiacus]|uniref:Serine phosphatase RsbU (Regulator of sigma subunit)/anti-sigma regulatory factor (Ser/Thr protein kinase) n=1 Tax=Kineococcus aurantiacus TaxID=37633 RepID=A0A7Y9DL25_9ACTN|nr:serine phosphatase RsbU (regulator of sigma subunit)/anti-sigma regulatory factor (Ser/Thr protein kinase) [Kineococcus aurantiacus]